MFGFHDAMRSIPIQFSQEVDEMNETRSLGTKNVPADPQKRSALTMGKKDSYQSCDILMEKDHKQISETARKEIAAYNVNHRENDSHESRKESELRKEKES